MNRDSKIILFATAMFLLLTVASGIMHEQVHVAIYENYGMTNASMGIFWGGLYTTAYGECNDSCALAHSINESISYNLQALMAFMLIMVVCIISMMGRKE